MSDFLTINGVDFPIPEGSFDITYKDKVNEYEAESGKKTVEIIRPDLTTISVTYNGIPEKQLNVLIEKIKIINQVAFNKNGEKTTILMKCISKKIPKKYIGKGIYMKGLSFTLEEL